MMKPMSIIVVAEAIARAAVGQPTVRATLLALSIFVGLSGCALSHTLPSDAAVAIDDGGRPPRATDAGPPSEPDGGDDADGDGYPASIDCDDTDATIHPGAMEEPCFLDGIDQDCDGWDLSEECESNPECLMWLCNG